MVFYILYVCIFCNVSLKMLFVRIVCVVCLDNIKIMLTSIMVFNFSTFDDWTQTTKASRQAANQPVSHSGNQPTNEWTGQLDSRTIEPATEARQSLMGFLFFFFRLISLPDKGVVFHVICYGSHHLNKAATVNAKIK